MSKSKGNVVTPDHLLHQHSADAVRYWAARARLGTDTAFDESIFAIGKKLATKLFNASKFVFLQLDARPESYTGDLAEVSECIDKAWLGKMAEIIQNATQSFEQFDYAGALEEVESGFWMFCDHYIELVKGRAYQETGPKQLSALLTLSWTLKTFLRLLAPVIPFITEEIWSWEFQPRSTKNSIHLETWPSTQELQAVVFPSWGHDEILSPILDILSEIRGAKTKAQKSMKHPVAKLTLHPSEGLSALLGMYPEILEDITRAGSIAQIDTVTGGEKLQVEVELQEG